MIAPDKVYQQWNEIKEQYPGVVLFYRMGDFFEAFKEDADICGSILGLRTFARQICNTDNLWARWKACGFPHHQLETYLAKLTRAGYRVAVCDQLENHELPESIMDTMNLEIEMDIE